LTINTKSAIIYTYTDEKEVKMALYTLSPKYKKSAIEVASWEKDGVTIFYREGYRSGTFYCESDTRPDISLADNEALDLGSADCGTGDCWEMEELWDGCWGGFEFPEDMPEEIGRAHV
jgi:hypothetical protein